MTYEYIRVTYGHIQTNGNTQATYQYVGYIRIHTEYIGATYRMNRPEELLPEYVFTFVRPGFKNLKNKILQRMYEPISDFCYAEILQFFKFSPI